LFDDSLKRHRELQKEYESALLENDKELAELRRSELELMEGAYRLSFSMFKVDELAS
jgi:uncharacterized membrane protein (DUF106 family)